MGLTCAPGVTFCAGADAKGDPLTLFAVFPAPSVGASPDCPGTLLFHVELGCEERGEPVLAPGLNDLPKGEYDFFSDTGGVLTSLLGCV